MDATLAGHALALVLLVGMPLVGRWEFGRLRAALERGDANSRKRSYRQVMVQEWVLALLATPLWYRAREQPSADQPGVAGWMFLLGSILVIGLIVMLTLQYRQLRRDARFRTEFRKKLADLRDLLPHRPEELHTFRALSVSAGVCEELVYRGFLVVYLGAWLHPAVAIAVAAAVFGLGHLYQGVAGIAKTAAVGLVMSGLVVLTGSLLHAMILHVAIDWINGDMAYHALQPEPESQDQPA